MTGLIWADTEKIKKCAARAISDIALQKNLNNAAEHEREARRELEGKLPWQEMRTMARQSKTGAIEDLPQLLDLFEKRAIEAGSIVKRATTGEEAAQYVASVCRAHSAKTVVKGKSMLSEEIDLNQVLASEGIEAIETDLGEYIVQKRGEHPSHILAPAVHLNAGQVGDLFSQLGGESPGSSDPAALVEFARRRLRQSFLNAKVGVSGANFAVAETGTLIIVESEGNIRMCMTMPDVHIAVVGIEKVVSDWQAAAHLVQMLPMAAQGTEMATNVSLITGPARAGEGKEKELHIVLVDSGRMKVREGPYREMLNCIHCAACLAACPVYRQVGGHTYGSTYNGPMGVILTPLLAAMEGGSAKLTELCSLCGACREVCPVDIPLDDFIIDIRSDDRESSKPSAESLLFTIWARLWSKPASYRASVKSTGKALVPFMRRAKARSWLSRAPFPASLWTKERNIKAPASEMFRDLWKKRQDGSR